MFYFLNPWGLTAFASLGVIVFLYFYVFRGRRREVSALFLWEIARSQRREGTQRRRPPITLPLILELLAALLLAFVIAGSGCMHTDENPHMVVVLDGSASMNAGTGQKTFRERAIGQIQKVFNQSGENARITLVETSYSGRILGQKAMARRRTLAVLEDWHPAAPSHNLRPAVEIARAMAGEQGDILLLTDHERNVKGIDTIAVGEPLPNTAWIACRWRSTTELFALARHFGNPAGKKEIILSVDGQQTTRRRVNFSERDTIPLTFRIPEQADTIRLRLPEDALRIDNTLRLSTPDKPSVRVGIDIDHKRLNQQLLAALQAQRKFIVEEEKPAVIQFTAFEAGNAPSQTGNGALNVRFRFPAKAATETFNAPYFVDRFHSLTRGVQLKGTSWRGSPDYNTRDAGTILASVGDMPLITLKNNKIITFNFNPDGSNLFRMPAWPVFISNLLRYAHKQTPGIKQHARRIGESVAFQAPDYWNPPLKVERPDGQESVFNERYVYLGQLKQAGTYKFFAHDEEVAAIDVNFMDASESDLRTASRTEEKAQKLTPGSVQAGNRHAFHAEFAAAAVLCLLGCWFLLDRNR